MAKISKQAVAQVRHRASDRCEYCLSLEWLTGQKFHIDRIIPQSKGGSDDLSNLCFACPGCNGAKLDRLTAIDQGTGEKLALFHPRQQRWEDHFSWSSDGTQIVGTAAVGRATVIALKLNRPLSVVVRAEWVRMHRHPPEN